MDPLLRGTFTTEVSSPLRPVRLYLGRSDPRTYVFPDSEENLHTDLSSADPEPQSRSTLDLSSVHVQTRTSRDLQSILLNQDTPHPQ